MPTITSSIGTASRNYSLLQTWEDALPASAVTAGNSYVGECYNDSEFTGNAPLLNISGTTTDSTHTITLKCASGHSFYDNAGKLTNAMRYSQSNGVAIRSTSGFLNPTVVADVPYTVIDGLQICIDFGSSTGNLIINGANFTVKNCILQATTNNGNAKSCFDASATGLLVNCLAIQEGAGGGFNISTTGISAINLTAIKTNGVASTAFNQSYGSPLVKNCVSYGFAAFGRTSSFPYASGSDYNATDLASGNYLGSGTHQVYSISNPFTSVTAGSVDARVGAGTALTSAGVRDATNTADLDIVKQARSTTAPTIGAWEYIASGFTVTVDGSLPVDWSSLRRSDAAVPAEFIASKLADANAQAEWTTALRANTVSQVEFTASLRIDGPAQNEWTGQVQIAADARVPLEWSSAFGGDARMNSDYIAAQRLDNALAAEFLMLRSIDSTMPAQGLAGVLVDGVARADWTGAVAVSVDARAPVEWSGGVPVTANALLPIEFGAGVAANARFQANWSAAFIGDRQIPADFNVGLIANQQGALDWLRTVFGDAVAPGETLVVISGSSSAPAEFGGASAFVPGNSEIFRVDARGYIWHVDARSTTWCPEARRTIWLPATR